MTAHGTDEDRLQRLQKLRDRLTNLEEQHRKLTSELNEEIYYAFPENRGETGKPRHGLITDLIRSSGKSRQHITDVRAGKYRPNDA
jgi:hypothetical protein